MIKAKKNRIFENMFSIYNIKLLKRHFYRIMLSGEENFTVRSVENPSIIYANHSNWWDGLAAFYLSEKLWNIDAYVMMDIEQMQKYRFFKRIGAFSVNRNNPKEAMESVEYAASLLQSTNRVLWIFPQGVMQPNDFRPIKFYSGISKIVQKLGAVNLIPVTLRYEFLMEQRPELFISIGKARTFNSGEDTKELTGNLNDKLIGELDALKNKIINSELDGFKIILQGKQSRNKTVDKVYGR
jgi:1-acyl-sn-glycerol-3-phosphate acyltransferase